MHAVAVHGQSGDAHVVFCKRFLQFFARGLVLGKHQRVRVRLAGIPADAQFKLIYAQRGEIFQALVQAVIAENAADYTYFHTVSPVFIFPFRYGS